MTCSRRSFLKFSGILLGGGLGAPRATASSGSEQMTDGYGMLIDTTECIGCRKCEWACSQENELTKLPLEAFEDEKVFEKHRWLSAKDFTVVNRHEGAHEEDSPSFVKSQCMHCLEPACVSACLVGAFEKTDQGAVIYDSWKCIGCRYCMVACPFEVPAYEFHDPVSPEVKKCLLCYDRFQEGGKAPACATICPPGALTFGKREDLLRLAHEKIALKPDQYHDHVYGEHEVGGTSVLYLSSCPMEEYGLPSVGNEPIPKLPETIQHSVMKFGIPPILLMGLLMAASKTMHPSDAESTLTDDRAV